MAAAARADPSAPPAAVQSSSDGSSPDGLMPDTPADPSRGLPEITVRNVGLHIGGEPNDSANKAPFQAALENKFEEFLACYRQVLEPAKGGVFGVDLFIRRAGGQPEVRQPRTGMKGTEFRKCVIQVFESVNFDPPKKGPTVISYSIKFDVYDSARAGN